MIVQIYSFAFFTFSFLISAIFLRNFSAPLLLVLLGLSFLISFIIRIVLSNRKSPIALFACIFLIFYYFMPSIFHVYSNSYPFFNMNYPDYYVFYASIISFTFVFMFVLGYLWRPFSKESRIIINDRIPTTSRVISTLALILIAVSSAAAVGFQVLTNRRGDVLINPIEFTPNILMLISTARNAAFVSLLFSMDMLLFRRTLLRFLIFSISLSVFLLIDNPSALPRFVTGAFLITAMVAFFPLKRGTKFFVVIVMVVAQFTIFPALSSWTRGSGDFSFALSTEYFSKSGDFDGFQSTINVVKWVNEEGPRLGNQLLSAAFFFIPRSIWGGKSPGTGLEAAEHAGYPFVNISSPMPSELYADFHFPGLVLLSVLFGRLVRRLDDWFEYDQRVGLLGPSVLVPALAAGYAPIIMRGALVSVLGPFVLAVGMVVTVFLLERRLSVRRGV